MIGECPASPREKQIHRIKMAAFKANVFKDDLYILCMSVWFGLEKERFYVSYRQHSTLYIAVGRGLAPHGWYGVGGREHRKKVGN